MIERLGARAIAAIILGLFVVGLLIFGVTQCQQRKSADKREEVAKEQGQASVGAGAEAINTVGNVATSDAETDAAVASGQDAIRKAPEGQKGAATKAAICRLKSYRDAPQCKEQQP